MGAEKIVTADFLRMFMKMVLMWASFSFLVFYMPINRWELVPGITHDALVFALVLFTFFTSVLIAYLST